MTPTTPVNVAIAVIQKDNQYLIAKRSAHGPFPNFWEFPGGKQLPNETPEECVIREVFEEISVFVAIERPYPTIRHCYADQEIILHPYLCRLVTGTPQSSQEIRWVLARALSLFTFPEASRPLLKALTGGVS
ncbi:MAG: (deoxy)nucleoside triphosphate pyrophosphohydrolase [Nitrospirota bacterium]